MSAYDIQQRAERIAMAFAQRHERDECERRILELIVDVLRDDMRASEVIVEVLGKPEAVA